MFYDQNIKLGYTTLPYFYKPHLQILILQRNSKHTNSILLVVLVKPRHILEV